MIELHCPIVHRTVELQCPIPRGTIELKMSHCVRDIVVWVEGGYLLFHSHRGNKDTSLSLNDTLHDILNVLLSLLML